jgi:hypothetical protein
MSTNSTNKIARERFAAFNRRQFLRGLGACVALPALETFLPGRLLAAGTDPAGKLATTASGAPLRFGVVYFPNGAIQPNWWPKGEDADFEFSDTMAPLQSLKNKIQVLGGMDQVNAMPGPDGAGDHARASGTFLTGVRVKKTAGSDIHAGISIDQVIASQVGHLTRYPSLELTCDAVRKSGNCDSGYSCAYQYNLSWRSPTTPIAPEPNPRLLFERLFGSGNHGERIESLKRRQQEQRSILDFVLDEAHSLERQLTYRDKQKLDEYLVSVREIEQRIQKAERFGKPADPNIPTPDGVPNGFEDYVQIMFDMMLVAFQTDSTRIATFLLANEGSNRPFPEIGIAEGHHNLTHHMNKQDMIEKVAQIDLWYMQQFGKFLEKMEKTKDVDGRSLLHNSMILYGSGNADGNRHTHTNLPVILAGGGGGTLTPGRFAKFGSVPMSNMLLGVAARMGACDVPRLGDSTGRLDSI